jgi:hypothetical protein
VTSTALAERGHGTVQSIRGVLFCTLALALLTTPALAAPAIVDVRIEGATQTLFEGPVRTDGHDVRAASDSRPRRCDTTNLHAQPSPGPSATAAAVDAMTLTGRGFDGQWYPGFDDYFIQQFGPDRENADTYAYWGVLVNRAFTPVGGCQVRVVDGDEVLWSYDAFNARPFLWLSAPVAAVAVGQPLTVTVAQSSGAMDGAPAGDGPAAGVKVAPVSTDAAGDETALSADPAAVTTAADGSAAVSFDTAGWHRLKALAGGYVRSNRLDVCVGACGAPPADTQVREPVATPTPTPTPEPTATPEVAVAAATPAPSAIPPLRLAPRVTAAGNRRGLIDVRWDGAGVASWTLDAAPAGTTAFTHAASGTSVSTELRLAAGRSYDLRLTATDTAGRAATFAAGRVLVPIDDRALRFSGARTRASSATAWLGTLSRASRGAAATVTLVAGRPVVLLQGATAGTRVRIAGKVFRLSRAARTITAAARTRSGRVRIDVLSGHVGIDGVAVAP